MENLNSIEVEDTDKIGSINEDINTNNFDAEDTNKKNSKTETENIGNMIKMKGIPNINEININNSIQQITTFDFEYAERKVMENVKIDDVHLIWQRIGVDGLPTSINVNTIRFRPNLLLAQIRLKELFSKRTISRKICDKKYCINPDCWIILKDDEANYKLAKLKLLRNSEEKGDCRLWTGYINSDGYVRTEFKGKDIGAHNLSFIVHMKKLIDDNLLVRHSCRKRNYI